jgi:methylated-DNA-[protein]-cysteine S-methyltransferase
MSSVASKFKIPRPGSANPGWMNRDDGARVRSNNEEPLHPFPCSQGTSMKLKHLCTESRTSKRRLPAVAILPVRTTLGTFAAHYSKQGLARLDFPAGQQRGFSGAGSRPENIQRWHETTSTAVREALEGRAPEKLPPLDLQNGTAFQRRVWEALIAIPPGQTITYGELAARVGAGRATRAAGAACGANPIPLLIPCHRVVAANGTLGGFSGGLHWKRKLLAEESRSGSTAGERN